MRVRTAISGLLLPFALLHTDTGAAGGTAELSREALEKEKADLDLMYQQLLEEREQIEK